MLDVLSWTVPQTNECLLIKSSSGEREESDPWVRWGCRVDLLPLPPPGQQGLAQAPAGARASMRRAARVRLWAKMPSPLQVAARSAPR